MVFPAIAGTARPMCVYEASGIRNLFFEQLSQAKLIRRVYVTFHELDFFHLYMSVHSYFIFYQAYILVQIRYSPFLIMFVTLTRIWLWYKYRKCLKL